MTREYLNAFMISKARAIKEVEDYLKQTSAEKVEENKVLQSCAIKRANIFESLSNPEKNLDEIVGELREIRDERTGIITHTIPSDGKNPAIQIRDARGCDKSHQRGYEASEMAMLNAVSAAFDILDDLDLGSKEEIKSQLRQVAIDFIRENNSAAGEPLDKEARKEVGKALNKKIKEVAVILAQNGVANPFEALNIGKDYQNFNYEQADVITISRISIARDDVLKKGAEKSGGTIAKTVIESEVGLRGLTDEQKAEYQAIKDRDDSNIPKWFRAISEDEQKFVRRYVKKIIEGKHVHPTQLRRIAGLKNAFEKITLIADEDGRNIRQLHSSLHAGTLGSANKDEKAAQKIATDNLKQVQAHLGDGEILHCNTFNTDYPISLGGSTKDDQTFVRQTKQAVKDSGETAKESNTAFNFFRRIVGTSDYSGVESSLKMISENVNLENKKVEGAINSYLKPKGFFGRIFRRIRHGSQDELLKNIESEFRDGHVGEESKKLLDIGLKLASSVEVAKSAIIDRDNANLKVNEHLNFFTYQLEKLKNAEPRIDIFDEEETQKELNRFKGLNWAKIPIEKILNMCASGKDRTGLSEHNQTSQAVVNDITEEDRDIDPKLLSSQIDEQILAAGHTANMAGDPIAGGGSIGAYGTKSENRAGIPNDRKKVLEAIIEPESKFNKIKKSKIPSYEIATKQGHDSEREWLEASQSPVIEIPAPNPQPLSNLFDPDHHFHPIAAYLQMNLTRIFIAEEEKLKDDLANGHFLVSEDKNHQKILSVFEKHLKAQEGKTNPTEPYKGVGIDMSLESIKTHGQCLKIDYVKSPEFQRFSSNGSPIESKDLEGKFVVEITVEKDGRQKTINIDDFIKTSRSCEDALSKIAAHFHGDDNVSFKTSDGEVYNCDKKAIFIGKECKDFSRHGNNKGEKYDPATHGLPNYIKSELEKLSLSVQPRAR